MSKWALIQIGFDLFFALGLFIVVMRMNRAPKDDPRLSRGLQLLQSKISVLEDLSDRTETQVTQLVSLLEQKAREVQAKVQLADQHVHEIRVSMERSLEVAKIFQDRIPHQEIIERQNSIKYVQAARLAHQGLSAEAIAAQVDLPKGEIEFIASVNRDQLMFDEEHLPEWARVNPEPENSQKGSFDITSPTEISNSALAEHQRLVENLSRLQSEMQNLDRQLARENSNRDLEAAFEVPRVETATLQKLGEEFRKACGVDAPLEPSVHIPSPQPQADPLLKRQMAQAKVQAALKMGEAKRSVDVEASAELTHARAMAQSLSDQGSTQKPIHHVINSRGTTAQPAVVKKVVFPRLQDGEA